jgi:hypothetical protein
MDDRSALRYRLSPNNTRTTTALSNHAPQGYYLAREAMIKIH